MQAVPLVRAVFLADVVADVRPRRQHAIQRIFVGVIFVAGTSLSTVVTCTGSSVSGAANVPQLRLISDFLESMHKSRY